MKADGWAALPLKTLESPLHAFPEVLLTTSTSLPPSLRTNYHLHLTLLIGFCLENRFSKNPMM